MKMNMKNIGMAITIAAGISLGATGVAQAAASASAEFTMANLIFTNNSNGDGTGTQLDVSDFNVGSLNFTGTAGINGSMTGAGGFLDSGLSIAGTPIDLAGQCVGAGCPNPVTQKPPLGGENNFAPNAGYPTIGNYASADQKELGSPISGLVAQNSATIQQGAWAGVDTGTAFGSADANNNLNATFEFTLASALPNGAGITFGFATYVEAFTDGTEVVPTTATASSTQQFQLFENIGGVQNLIFSWDPGRNVVGGTEVSGSDITNSALTRQAPANGRTILGGGAIGTEISDSFAASTGALAANQSYTLVARSNVNVDVIRAAVPEPSILAIFGAGLVGMSVMRRRRRKAS